MAERQISADSILLFIDPAAGTDYSLVVCLENQSMANSSDEIDATSKCGQAVLPGKKKSTIDFSGFRVLDPDTDRISEDDLFDLWKSQTQISFKYGPAVPVSGDISYTGKGYLIKYDLEDSLSSAGKFSATISLTGDPVQTTTA